MTLSSPSGQIKHGGDEVFLTFKDANGKLVDVIAVTLVPVLCTYLLGGKFNSE